MIVLVTGAEGFVASHLIPKLVAEGHEVVAAVREGVGSPPSAFFALQNYASEVLEWDLTDAESVAHVGAVPTDAVVHLAAVASVADAIANPGLAWDVNASGTARLAEALGRRAGGRSEVTLLIVSSGEVYGAAEAERPRVEGDPVAPVSPYAASKLGAEIAGLEIGRRTGLKTLVARAFGHTGPNQDPRYVIPTFAGRILMAKRLNAPAVTVGNLEPVREFMHVADVVDAYHRLLHRGRPGEVYNVASGRPVSLRDVFHMISDAAGHRVIPEVDATLVRPVDIPYLVGDASKLQAETGWTASTELLQTIKEVVDAQAD